MSTQHLIYSILYFNLHVLNKTQWSLYTSKANFANIALQQIIVNGPTSKGGLKFKASQRNSRVCFIQLYTTAVCRKKTFTHKRFSPVVPFTVQHTRIKPKYFMFQVRSLFKLMYLSLMLTENQINPKKLMIITNINEALNYSHPS